MEHIDPGHPVVACARQAAAALAEAVAFEPAFMPTSSQREALMVLTELERRAAGLKLRLLAASGVMAEEDGARDPAAWLAARTQADPVTLRAEQQLAEAVDQKWARVGAALAAGEVSADQAQVIVRALEALPVRVGLDVVERAEVHLVELAAQHHPKELRVLGRRILDVVAPEVAEGEEARRLQHEEQHARDACRLTLKPLGDGSTRISGLLPDASAQRLATYLHAFASPRKHPEALGGEEDRIPYRRRLGQAFCALVERLDPEQLPEHGGDATRVMVTIPLASLREDLGVGSMVGGDAMSASEIRRLACQAGIIPVVLGGKGEVLDLGRTRRLHSPAQRRALRLRDQTCRSEGCSIPAAWCEAHHDQPWSNGGRTNVDDGRLYCSYHHHRAHDPRYQSEKLANGDVRFHRRR